MSKIPEMTSESEVETGYFGYLEGSSSSRDHGREPRFHLRSPPGP